jgi:hypothetical protein
MIGLLLLGSILLGQGTVPIVNPVVDQIIWDPSSRRQIAPLQGEQDANYARMIQLYNGDLCCVYERKGSIECTASRDLGKTWQSPVTIAPATSGVNMSVPEILELKDHSLLVSYNPRPHKINGDWDTTKRFEICTVKSYDGGRTWQDQRLLYQAGYRFEDGCWEPSQIQLPSGEVQLYFSNEGVIGMACLYPLCSKAIRIYFSPSRMMAAAGLNHLLSTIT